MRLFIHEKTVDEGTLLLLGCFNGQYNWLKWVRAHLRIAIAILDRPCLFTLPLYPCQRNGPVMSLLRPPNAPYSIMVRLLNEVV